MTDRFETNGNVTVGERSMQVLALNSPLAPAGKSAVSGADAAHTDLVKGSPVGQAASHPMAECNCCKRERAKEHKEPRQLERLPTEITQCKDFRRKGLPVQLCPYCDSGALESALAEHAKRIRK